MVGKVDKLAKVDIVDMVATVDIVDKQPPEKRFVALFRWCEQENE